MKSRRIALWIAGAFLVGVAASTLRYAPWQQWIGPQSATATRSPTLPPSPTPTPRPIVDFHMADLQHGWIRYADGRAVTEDGGANWREAASEPETSEPEPAGVPTEALFDLPHQATVSYGALSYPVSKVQFLTDRVGWALVESGKELKSPLLVTVDGGETWNSQVTPELEAAIQAEAGRLEGIRAEAALYASPDVAKRAVQSTWLLLPGTASPGDVVLVRHNQPGDVQWAGKTYPLQPFGAGYFTYLPIAMQTKPGAYSVGDQTLTIAAKKFETQYLQVSDQMESMKQDTKRIDADQVRIDAARSKSAPTFLFTQPFLQPIQGILTTPFGYTRYVNGKLDSTHTALDLVAKTGTPIQATNDGIVALADSLYLTGNTVYIDHGMGLFSQYAHLSELKVKTGDRVKRGDIIGLVGTTGFSTGPHLHFTFWAHNVPVNPNLFFDTTPFGWLKK